MAGANIGANVLIRERGWDFELREDEQVVYDALVCARRGANDKSDAINRQLHHDSERDLVYGNPLGTRLVFVQKSKALENIAFRRSRTWGEFGESAPLLYLWALQCRGVEDKPPPDDEKLDHEALSADGDFPYFPEQLMLELIPKSIQDRMGYIGATAHNGPMLELDPKFEMEVIEELRQSGFRCQRDDKLFEELYS